METAWCTSGAEDRGASARGPARRHRRDPGRSRTSRRSSRPRCEQAAEQDARRPAAARPATCTDLEFVTIDPAGADGPRPGDAPGARRRRLRRALRDRRRDGVRRAGRPGRRGGAPARASRSTAPTARSRCTRRCSARARLAAARPGPAGASCGRSGSTPTVRCTDATVERARVRSRQQARLRGRAARDRRRLRRGSTLAAAARRSASCGWRRRPSAAGCRCRMPAQEIDVEDGRWRLEYREMLPVESWNAQISLLTGFAAASIMIEGKVGHPAHAAAGDPTRRSRGCVVRRGRWGSTGRATRATPTSSASLDPSQPGRGGDGRRLHARCSAGPGTPPSTAQLPDQPSTRRSPRRTPMSRRRCAGWSTATACEICAALCAGQPVPEWVLDGLADLPDDHAASRAAGRSAYENAVLNLVEALTLAAPGRGEVRRGRDRGRPQQ